MTNSQTLLSQLRIPYDKATNQQDIDDIANATRVIRKALVDGVHKTKSAYIGPDLMGISPVNGGTNFAVSAAMATAVYAYEDAYKKGDLPAVHACVDRLNSLYYLDNQPFQFTPPADFDILLSAPGLVGQLAQSLAGQRAAAIAQDPTDTNLLPPIFDPQRADPIFAADAKPAPSTTDGATVAIAQPAGPVSPIGKPFALTFPGQPDSTGYYDNGSPQIPVGGIWPDPSTGKLYSKHAIPVMPGQNFTYFVQMAG